jgi:glucose/arabinose dehydrogenase
MTRPLFSAARLWLGATILSLFAVTATPARAQDEAPAATAEGRGRAGGGGAPARGGRGGRGNAPPPPRYLETKILEYYDIEDIALPSGARNTDGIAVMPDGRIVVCFQAGQVYFYTPATKEWKLFAEGLHWPLGVLPVSNTEIMVMQAPELTLLADRDGDGRAEVFKTISDDFGMSGNYAEFHTGPVKDPQGNLFYSLGTGSHFGSALTNEVRGFFSPIGAIGRMTSPVPYRGWVMKVSPDGKTTPFAVGLREANGLGIDPKGRLFGIDNQGDWVGASALYHLEEGKFYGHVPPLVWRKDFQGADKFPLDLPVAELDRLRTRAAVVFPYGEMSNSPTQPLWDNTGGKFGPFAGQMFIGEMNFRRIMRVMLEDVDGQVQGAVSPFFESAKLHLGNVRLAFDQEGGLWVAQTFHPAWTGESGLQRIKWKGIVPLEISAMKVTETGFNLAFTRPVDAAIASNPETYAMRTYFYNYHEAYGSNKFDLKDVKIASAVVSPDRLSVALTLESLEAWRIYDMKFKGLRTADGHELVNSWIVYTLNHLVKDTPPPRAPVEGPPKPPRRPAGVPPGGVRGVGGPQDFK